jgi:signal peptidase I
MNLTFWKKKPTTPAKPKGPVREWTDAIVFAVLAATLIRWATFEAYTIPTPSMENSLLVGDYLFVSKLHYGPTTPITPLQLPLTHQTIPGTSLPAFSDAIQLPQWRLPGFSEVKSGDVVVFHVPTEAQYPPDLRTNYIKRCVAVAGDELLIKRRQVYVNGKPMENPPQMQYAYVVRGTSVLNEETFFQRGIQTPQGDAYGNFLVHCTPAVAKELKSLPFVKSVDLYANVGPEPDSAGVGSPYLFPNSPDGYLPPSIPSLAQPKVTKPWTKDNYGPLHIPKKGETVQLNATTIPIYVKIILRYEDNPGVKLGPDGLLYQANGQLLTQYTVKQNYYFMMGDNRHNSEDSRFWGFVPEEEIVGKAVFIWMSSNPHPEQGGSSIRWNRLFSIIH